MENIRKGYVQMYGAFFSYQLFLTLEELEKMKGNTEEYSHQDEIGEDTNPFSSNYEDGNR